MIRIIGLLGTNRTALMDDDDYQSLRNYRYYYDPGHGTGYVAAVAPGKCLTDGERLHTLLMGRHSGLHVDHIDGNGLNNTRDNLRVVTPQSNQINRKRLNKNNSSGIRGVYFVKRRAHLSTPWKAALMVHRRSVNLGYFASREDATAARRHAELKYFGEACPVPMGGA